jgi:hypothetical protein
MPPNCEVLSIRTDKTGMAHKILASELVEEPPDVVTMERRRTPQRRVGWRGGRRDSDWRNRPHGVLARVTTKGFDWRAWLKSR